MFDTLTITKARTELLGIPKKFAKAGEPSAVTVTHRGKPVLAILPWDFYESLVETLEILGDEALVAQLRQGIRELKAGKGIPWEKAKRDLDL